MAILSLSFWLHLAKIKWPRIRLTAHLLAHLMHILLNKYMKLLHRQNWLTICFPCLRIAPKQSLSSSASSSYWIHKSVKEDALSIFEKWMKRCGNKKDSKQLLHDELKHSRAARDEQQITCCVWSACARARFILYIFLLCSSAWNQKFSATTCAPRYRLFSRFNAT